MLFIKRRRLDGHKKMLVWVVVRVLSCFFVLFLTKILWRRWKYDLHRIPSPPTIPFFLATLKVMGSTDKGDLSMLRGRWWKKLGCPKLMKSNALGDTVVYVFDMNCAKSVVMSSKDPFPKSNRRNKQADRLSIMLTGDDLSAKSLTTFAEATPYVKSVRKIYTTAFQSSNLKIALPKLKAVCEKMLTIIDEERNKGPIDFQKLCVNMTLDSIGEVAFECSLGGLDGSRNIQPLLHEVGRIIVERRANPLTRFKSRFFPNCETIRKQEDTIRQLKAEWTRILEDVLEREDPPPGEEPIWYGLKRLTDPETGESISRATLLSELALVVLTGMDTTGHQLAWLLAILSNHPKAENKLLEELEQHGLMGPVAREATLEDLGDLTYLNACIKEGMRVATILLGTVWRRTPNDLTLLGYRLPKGTAVALPGNRWVNSEADWGPDPDAFKPERWLTEEDMSQKYYLGFSFGPRDCVGQRLALTEMKMALIAILRRYRLSLTVPYETLLKNSRNAMAIEVRDGIWFNVSIRKEM